MNEDQDYEVQEGYPNSKDFAKVLLGELRQGYEVHQFGNFIPSYIFELVRNLAEESTASEGFLDLWLQVPFRFNNRPDAIALLVEFIRKSADSLDESVQFVEDCLALIEAKLLSVGITYFKADAPKTPLSRGIVLDRENEDDLWVYADNRATKPKNWISTSRSWIDNEFVEARRTLQNLIELSSGNDGRLDVFRGGEAIGWLGYASDWAVEADYYELESDEANDAIAADPDEYLSVEAIINEIVSSAEDDESVLDVFDRHFYEIYDSVLSYLNDLDEFAGEDDYVYVDEVGERISGYIESRTQEIDCQDDRERYSSLGEHHLPPVTDPYRYESLDEATCTCICGERIIRRYGCHEISW